MKYFCLFLLLFSASAFGETVINYDDGSTLTLTEGEKIHVTKGQLYQQKTYSNGKTIQFKLFPETARRDYVPTPVDNMQPGSHEWCKTYIPWSEGLTFDMITWQRACDTDNDGKYGCGDSQFDASEDSGVCT